MLKIALTLSIFFTWQNTSLANIATGIVLTPFVASILSDKTNNDITSFADSGLINARKVDFEVKVMRCGDRCQVHYAMEIPNNKEPINSVDDVVRKFIKVYNSHYNTNFNVMINYRTPSAWDGQVRPNKSLGGRISGILLEIQ